MQMTQNPTEATKTNTSITDFRELNLSELTLAALRKAGFETPSPVQLGLIPPALEGRDCLGSAPTGTGKTAAFLVPLIEAIDDRARYPQALILAPTRELVHQIGREFERLSFGRRTRAVAVVGGESMFRQLKMLDSGSQLILATPGRLMDLMERGSVRLDRVKHVVLDEADQMLDIGFRPAVEAIMDAIPTPRQTLLLSATMPRGVIDLSRRYLHEPAHVRLNPEGHTSAAISVQQRYIMVHEEHKLELLLRLLEHERPERTIVFCRTKHGADKLGTLLRRAGVKAEAMHGDLAQSKRNRVLDAFRSGRLQTLAATDVVGRGIDVPEVSHVVNFDLPEGPEHYVHRIGRTGRLGGSDGMAYSFVRPNQGSLLDLIEKAIRKPLEAHTVEGFDSPPRPSLRRFSGSGAGANGKRRGPFGGRGPGRGGSSFQGRKPRRDRVASSWGG
ncbi:DEAD/DEAH box helicase [soil metagenome]